MKKFTISRQLPANPLYPAALPGHHAFKGLPLWQELSPALLVARDGHLSRYKQLIPTAPR